MRGGVRVIRLERVNGSVAEAEAALGDGSDKLALGLLLCP